MAVGLSAVNTANVFLNTFDADADHIKLHTGDPGASGATAAAVGDATRKVITWAAASGGSKAMSGTPPVWTNGGTSETISHITAWDLSAAGDFCFSAALTASQAWVTSNTFTLTALTVSFTPIAA